VVGGQDGIRISDVIATKKTVVPVDDLKSPVFAETKHKLEQCFGDVVVVFEPNSAKN
jgi:hypothetical protein